MGTLISIYTRVQTADAADSLRKAYPSAYTERGSDFYAVDDPRGSFRCPEEKLQVLSQHLQTDVIWLSFQSLVDAFQYHRWSNGKHIRSLVYGTFKEREWERAEGPAEPWEDQALFNPVKLASELEYIEDADQRRSIEEVFAKRLIVLGQSLPHLDARDGARGIAKSLRLPGWGFDNRPQT